MDAEARHYFRVTIERLIRQEMLAVFREAARVRGANSDADATPLTEYLIKAVEERIKRGEIDAKIVPQF